MALAVRAELAQIAEKAKLAKAEADAASAKAQAAAAETKAAESDRKATAAEAKAQRAESMAADHKAAAAIEGLTALRTEIEGIKQQTVTSLKLSSSIYEHFQ